MCGGWGDVPLARTHDEILDFFRNLNGYKEVHDWIFKILDIIFESKEEATYDIIRVRECLFALLAMGESQQAHELTNPLFFLQYGSFYLRRMRSCGSYKLSHDFDTSANIF